MPTVLLSQIKKLARRHSWTRGADYDHHITACPPWFGNLKSSLFIPGACTKTDIFDSLPPPHLVHVVIEWPQVITFGIKVSFYDPILIHHASISNSIIFLHIKKCGPSMILNKGAPWPCIGSSWASYRNPLSFSIL